MPSSTAPQTTPPPRQPGSSQPPTAPTLLELTPRPGERFLAVGGTRVGKSTLTDFLLREFAAAHECEILILDSKPRFRAEETSFGRPAREHYRKWAPGPTIPGSVRLDIDRKRALDNAFRNGRRIAIAQTDDTAQLPYLLRQAELFFDRADAKKPRVLYVDELADFFTKNGWPKMGSDIIERVYRAGGERGLGGWSAAQRPRGIPVTVADFSDEVAVFRMNNQADVAYLHQLGLPRQVQAPDTPHVFRLWRREWLDRVLTSRLEVPPHYLASLSKT